MHKKEIREMEGLDLKVNILIHTQVEKFVKLRSL